jgi:hypothetical protein
MLYDAAGNAGLYINSDYWTTPVYHATKKTPRIVVRIENHNSRITIPYTPAWHPSPDGDAHIAIIDNSTGCDYEFQQFDPRTLTAIGEGTYRVFSGSGAHVRTGHTGSALSLLAGLIRPSDIKAGVIHHALAFAAPVTGPGFVSPATSSDGRNPDGIPEGTRFRLDPTLDLSSLGLSPVQLIVARALQRYGMYLRDTGGAVAIFAESTFDGSSYSTRLEGLPREILLHMQAVAPPTRVSVEPQNPRPCAKQRS